MSMTPPPPPPPPGAPPPPPPMPPGGDFSAAGPVSPAGQELAGPWLRVVARLLDGIIVGIIFGLVFAAIVLNDGDTAGFGGVGGDGNFGRLYLYTILIVAAGFVWDAVFTKLFGGTPMKLALGMKVVRADNGGPVEWSHAITRWAIPGVFSLVPIPVLPGLASLIITIVSLVFIFSKPLRQAVWDLVAKTLVVKSR